MIEYMYDSKNKILIVKYRKIYRKIYKNEESEEREKVIRIKILI